MFETVLVNSDRWFENNDFKNEVWKDFEYNGNVYYQVSNYGRARSLDRYRILFNGVKAIIRGKILKAQLSKKGYYSYHFSFDGVCVVKRVNRIVAELFIPNPNNYPEVNHIDENTKNNCVNNLEWCTHKYNMNYGTRTIRVSEKTSKKIEQYDLQGNFIKEWDSLASASRSLNISRGTLCSCIKGQVKSCGGYQWKYKNSDKKINVYKSKIVIRKVVQLDLENNFINIYDNLHEAERCTGISTTQIRKCCNKEKGYRSAKGFKWLWESDYYGK